MNAHAYSDETTEYVESSGANMREIADAVGETAARASQGADAAHVAREAMDQVEETSRVLERRVEALTEASQRINSILTSIEAIASQTNLLALNATIEAARAGEAGRGFAVVAGEVKTLAGQTAQATEDIAARINTLDTEVKEILDGVRGSGTAIARGREAVDMMTQATEQVATHLNDLQTRVRV
ncbi:MAG: methyl-accepting chemotaxis protein [Maricaulis sp.]|jgi:methyl-accepting chemotaxis protein|nr:methyl-accepting chemotaxis protein [Maricaulis sp.]